MRAALGRLLPLSLHTGARILAALLAFFASALLAHRTDPATLGLFAMVLAVQGHVAEFAEGGIRAVQLALAGRDPAMARAAMVRCVLLRHLLGLAVGLPALLFASGLLPEGGTAALAVALLAISAQALRMDWAALAAGRHGEALLVLLARPLAWLALLLLLPTTVGATALTAGWVAAWGIAALISLPALRHLPKNPALRPPAAVELLRRALSVGLSAVLRQGMIGLDALLVGSLLGAATAGPYWLAASLATAAMVGANAAHQLALPALARPGAERGLAAELLPVGLAGTVVTVGLVLLGPPLVPVLFGARHAEAAALLPAFGLWVLAGHPLAVLQAAAAARGRGRLLLAADLAGLLAAGLVLALAAHTGDSALFALSRGMGDLGRLAVLVPTLPWARAGRSAHAASRTASLAPAEACVPSPMRSSTTISGGRAKRTGSPVVPTPAVTSR